VGVLGEPLHQLRELIKDLWFRNRQERIAGELDLIERQMQIAQTFGLDAGGWIRLHQTLLADGLVMHRRTQDADQQAPQVGEAQGLRD
jgi:hypothetical protein